MPQDYLLTPCSRISDFDAYPHEADLNNRKQEQCQELAARVFKKGASSALLHVPCAIQGCTRQPKRCPKDHSVENEGRLVCKVQGMEMSTTTVGILKGSHLKHPNLSRSAQENCVLASSAYRK